MHWLITKGLNSLYYLSLKDKDNKTILYLEEGFKTKEKAKEGINFIFGLSKDLKINYKALIN